MITLYSGIPGSGKSYKMVHDMTLEKGHRFIIHNIDGLAKDYLSASEGINFLEYCEEKKMDVIEFFSKEYQMILTAAVREKYHKNCLCIIDECHEWFDKNKKELKMWLSYHRHLNQDIWLVAHRSTNLPQVYRSFIEIEYRAKSSSILQLPGFFLYNRIMGGEQVGYKFTKKKQQVFALYKSMEKGFKKKSPSLLLPFALLFIIGGVVFFLTMPARAINKGKKLNEPSSSIERVDIKNEAAVDYVYAGMIGNRPVVKELSSKKTMFVDEMPLEYIIMKMDKNKLILFDVKNQKNIELRMSSTFKESPVESKLKI